MTFAHTHARAHDPDTSAQAAETVRDMAAQHKVVIAKVLAFGAFTSAEISDRCGLTYWQVTRRVSDLKHDGQVIDSGARRLTPNGRKACVWRLAEGQIEMFA